MDAQKILSFWRDVEIFNLPNLGENAKLLKPNALLPWQEKRELKSENYTQQYTLYFGRLEKQSVIDTIENALVDTKTEGYVEPVTGYTWLSALILDENGRPDENSYVQASFFHGINSLKKSQNLDQVGKSLMEVQMDFEARYEIPPSSLDEKNKPIKRKGIEAVWQVLKKECELLFDKCEDWNTTKLEVFYTTKTVLRTAEVDPAYLNSFYLYDLRRLAAADPSKFSKPLWEYLTVDVTGLERKDIVLDKKAYINSLDPKNLPSGRWPNNVNHGLFSAQLGAISNVISNLKHEGGLRGINGPPGTGKTKILKDIIADVIVTRALKLCSDPGEKIFIGEAEELEGERGTFYGINTKLMSDSGIVVASSNNDAVENITKELPKIKDIDLKSFPNANYFADQSQKLLAEKCWGILSAPLGKTKKRKGFLTNFWYTDANKEGGFWKFLCDIENSSTKVSTKNKEELQTLIKDLIKLKTDFDLFKLEASKFHNMLDPYLEKCTQREVRLKELDETKVKSEHISSLLKNEEGLIKDLDESLQVIKTTIELQNITKPSFYFFKKLFNTRDYQDWLTPVKMCLEQLQSINEQRQGITQKVNKIKIDLEEIKVQETTVSNEIEKLNQFILDYQSMKKYLIEKYGMKPSALIDEQFLVMGTEEQHLINPYSSTKINKLRSDIFIQSLKVHELYILLNAQEFKCNLELFVKMISGITKFSGDKARALWATFFFCVPVVSTTLASSSSLFANLDKDDIAWLLLDESGQATPQSVVGLLSRSKRSIVVGDPLQIEPVITMPKALIKLLQSQDHIPEVWSPTTSSVQNLADRVSLLGTYMKTGLSNSKVWTGFPLRTHFRCKDPMFTISNQISYSNQMVYATPDILMKKNEIMKPSQWLHVKGKVTQNKHVVDEEIERLVSEITSLRNTGYMSPIYVITPFKAIADKCLEIYPKPDPEKPNPNIPVTLCGTIHTFQGKEAEVVFLVLGTQESNDGARIWASEKPNMLNVALTRAKEYFYVIGNKDHWSDCQNFNQMLNMLEDKQLVGTEKTT